MKVVDHLWVIDRVSVVAPDTALGRKSEELVGVLHPRIRPTIDVDQLGKGDEIAGVGWKREPPHDLAPSTALGLENLKR